MWHLINIALAQVGGGVTLLEPFPGGEPNPQSLGAYLADLFPWFIGFIALLAMVMLIWGGFQYMFSGIPGIKTEAKQRIWAAILGLLLALSAYLVLHTINPEILNWKNITGGGGSGGGGENSGAGGGDEYIILGVEG